MKLSLSTAASPGTELAAFAEATRARGLDGVEVVLAEGDDIASVVAHVRASTARVVALRAEGPHALDPLLRASSELGALLSIPATASVVQSTSSLSAAARTLAGSKGALLLAIGTHLDHALAATARLGDAGESTALGLCWDIQPNTEDLRSAGPIFLCARDHLRLVRLYGGGPEQRDQDGRGVGPLFVDLAISGYDGPIVLTPSQADEVPRWREWLATRKIAGCGSSHPLEEHSVDVRDVEPKDRLGTILGAFAALPRGATLHITLDHDPSCMYYALEETQPAGSFKFRKVGDGPEVWGAEVTRI